MKNERRMADLSIQFKLMILDNVACCYFCVFCSVDCFRFFDFLLENVSPYLTFILRQCPNIQNKSVKRKMLITGNR